MADEVPDPAVQGAPCDKAAQRVSYLCVGRQWSGHEGSVRAKSVSLALFLLKNAVRC